MNLSGFTALAVVVLALAACSSDTEPADDETGTPSPSVSSPTAIEAALAKYEQLGYTGHRNDAALFWRHIEPSEAPECVVGLCVSYQVVAPEGCDDVYVEANFLDDAGNVIDWSNDTVSHLGPGDTAIVQFIATVDGATQIRITEASCS